MCIRDRDRDVDYITLGLHSTVIYQKYCTIAARKNQGAAFLRPFLGGTAMAKAKKLPSGKWRALVYDYTDSNGKRKYQSFTAETKKEAEFLAAHYCLNKKVRSSPHSCLLYTSRCV